ncbi:MAG TPA: group II intron reverse transcriptase/maturase [Acidiferrobacterales bacterium]|nr:group II intron reverse transcriptase/maturase [Acidiferrobacterales bacterium]
MSDTSKQSESEAPGVPKVATQGAQAQGRDWSWVEACVWNERMLAALDNGVKGGKWYSLIDKVYRPATLQAAWHKVAANAGAAGVDRQSVEQFAARAEVYLGELEAALKAGSYEPLAVLRVEIPKGPGKVRPLGIPAVKDRIVQTAVKRVLEPIFEREFLETSYGFRPGRGCKDALREVDRLLKAGYTQVVDADLASYFDTIPHAPLMARVGERVGDGRVLQLIEAFLHQDIVKGVQRWTPTGGTPQGAVISPLLANLYLHPLDCAMRERGYQMVRYADDFVVLCQTAEEARAGLAEVRAWVQANGLTLNPDKTHVGDCREEGQGFDFLGYRFEAGQRRVRRKSLTAIRDRIRAKTGRTRGDSLACIIAELNPMLQGWYGYFQHAHPWTFSGMDGFVRRRLRSLRRKQQKRPGTGRTLADHHRWPNAFFAELGLFTMTEAHALASRPR